MAYDKILIIKGVPHALVKGEKSRMCSRCSLRLACVSGRGLEDYLCEAVLGYLGDHYRFEQISARQLVDSLNEHRASRSAQGARSALAPLVYNSEIDM